MKAFAAAGASHHAMARAAELLVMVESRFQPDCPVRSTPGFRFIDIALISDIAFDDVRRHI
jgi:hypothetical protein